MNHGAVVLAAIACCGLAGCAGSLFASDEPVAAPQAPQAVATPAAYSVDRLIGSWGVASYRNDKDKARTETQARAQCKIPYKITKGPTDGVMMYAADDSTPHELTLKGSSDGKTYLGFAGPPGDTQDREILSFNDNMFVARYVDPDTDSRYGTLIYVRCKAARG